MRFPKTLSFFMLAIALCPCPVRRGQAERRAQQRWAEAERSSALRRP